MELEQVAVATTLDLRREVRGWTVPMIRIDDDARHPAVIHENRIVGVVSSLST